MESDRIPFIISRICGVCSTAHIMASVKAIESVFGVEIPNTARKLRELLMMGQIISNHSLVAFFLTLPDFWFSPEEDPKRRNIFQVMQENPGWGRKAIALRMFGARILEAVGKRDVHIFSVIPGGIINSLRESEQTELLKNAENAFAIAKDALTLGKELFDKNWDDFKKAGDYRTHYLAITNEEAIDFYDGAIRAIGPQGEIVKEFTTKDYMEHVVEKTYDWTYAKFAFLKTRNSSEEIVQVGPTARMNVNKTLRTEEAAEEFAGYKKKFGSPTHATLLFDYARLIDLLYACERARELLKDRSLTATDTRTKVKPCGGTGIGVVEAPRGTLAHQYTLTPDGHLRTMKLVIPTQINNAAINLNVKEAASQFIHAGEVKEGLLNRIEMVIRAYDPCIKCATRQENQKTAVDVRNHRGDVIRTL
jgi:F420-non-reducing hydrogenase large subunit